MRMITALAAAAAPTAGLMGTAGPAVAAVHPAEQGEAALAHRAGAFFEQYRGHHIMGWGRDETACAYIDGVQLVLYPAGNDRYLSALQAYQQERGVRAITKASVRVLSDLRMAPPTDPAPHCPQFVPGRRAAR